MNFSAEAIDEAAELTIAVANHNAAVAKYKRLLRQLEESKAKLISCVSTV